PEGDIMNAELKAMACLLVYPRKQLIDELGEIEAYIQASTSLNQKVKDSLSCFINKLEKASLTSIQRVYVATFDMGRRASLNLFEHLHGDSRGRGPAMVNLTKLYEDHGLKFESDELPDFLPAVLEFLSGLSFKDAQLWLQSATPLISSIDTELQLMDSPWAAVTAGLLAFADAPREKAELQRDDLIPSIDAEWKDAPVTFGASPNPVEQEVKFSRRKPE
ncbi:MAG: nitrate reductase molybdenum cofactor assembly chaperone, partial [Burkholderiales bacterium]|nr:nitrate reductase molybdenum cofactor assembly chaperone [Burkholderiales bacterium]